MRQVRYRLSYLLEALRAYLVEQQRQYYRKRELQYALYKAYLQRVPDEPPAVKALKEHVEVLPAHPRAAPYALAERVVLKRQHIAGDWHIADQYIVHNSRRQQQVKRPTRNHTLPQRLARQVNLRRSSPLHHTSYPIFCPYFNGHRMLHPWLVHHNAVLQPHICLKAVRIALLEFEYPATSEVILRAICIKARRPTIPPALCRDAAPSSRLRGHGRQTRHGCVPPSSIAVNNPELTGGQHTASRRTP